MYWLIVILLLSGCITPEQRYAQAVNECVAIANNYDLGNMRDTYIRQCAAMQPGGGTGTTTYQSSGSAYGRADAFGPYGVWGPTWEQFNQQSSPPVSPPLQPGGGFGQPDAFGPYGNRGPTWEQFNQQFQQPPKTR